ncbi:unnamed protein product, partial [Discosporangium mesarthrocarpum]
GTILASVTGVARVLMEMPFTIRCATQVKPLVVNAFMGLTALLLGNTYIVGINQIYDVEIDKVASPNPTYTALKRAAWY